MKLNEEQTKLLLKIGATQGYMINILEDAEGLGMVNQPYMRAAKHFMKHLLNSEELICAGLSESASEQLNESYQMIESIIELSLTIDNKKVKSFTREFKELGNKYNN